MSYKLSIRIINDTEDDIRVVEKACKGGDAKWSYMKHGYALTMSTSGNAGLLVFETTWGEKFALATGVHNYKRWIDLHTNVDGQNAEQWLEKYFTGNAPEDAAKWKQLHSAQNSLSEGKKLDAFYYVNEGNDLRGVFVYH